MATRETNQDWNMMFYINEHESFPICKECHAKLKDFLLSISNDYWFKDSPRDRGNWNLPCFFCEIRDKFAGKKE